MKSILYAWELGDGLGHLQNLALAAETCADLGVPVFAVPETQPAAVAYLAARGFTNVITFTQPTPRIVPDGWTAASFADCLNVYAYGSAERLAPLAAEVRRVLAEVGPACLVAECAPTFAMLAEPCIAMGTSWGLPADVAEMPLYPWAEGGSTLDSDWTMLEVVREVVQSTRGAYSLAQCVRPAVTLPLCYPGMDVWGAARGIGPARAFTPAPAAGAYAFAYLSPEYPQLDALIESLEAAPYAVKIHVRGSSEPFDLAHEMEMADRVIHHGSAGIAHAALGAGRPQVVFPYHAENTLNAQRLLDLGVAIGAGHAQPERFADVLGVQPPLADRIRKQARDVAESITTYPGLQAIYDNVRRAIHRPHG